MPDYPGGCLCGAVRYRLGGYSDAGYCHCSRCRKFTGAPVTAWALAPAADFAITAGEPARYETRRFCGACGSSLFRDLGDAVSVHVATLDEPNAIAPAIHQCVEQQLDWVRFNDLLPWVEGAELTPPSERRYLRPLAPDPAVTRSSEVTLREVDLKNLRHVVFADVAGSQRRFVALNAASVAQGMIQGDAWIRAIYAGDAVVGFAMAETIKEDELGLPLKGDPYLWRFMIDSHYQGMGFGGRALELILAELRTWPNIRNLWVSCVPGTGSPYSMYIKYGFTDTGIMDDGEVILRMPLE